MTVRHQVLVPVFNGAAHIDQTLKCILAQDLPGMQVLVSDNASDDETPEILRRYSSHPRVAVSRSSINLGMFGNWDRLLNMVTAESYTLISHDDLFSGPTVLSQALRALHSTPDCPAVFSDIAYINGEGTLYGHRRFARKGAFDAMQWIRRSVLSCRNQLGQPIAIRTEAARGLKFDPELKYAGDFGFAAHLALTRGMPVHIPEPLFRYRMHGASGTLKLQKHALDDMRKIAADLDMDLTSTDRMRQWIAFQIGTRARANVLRLVSLQIALRNRTRS